MANTFAVYVLFVALGSAAQDWSAFFVSGKTSPVEARTTTTITQSPADTIPVPTEAADSSNNPPEPSSTFFPLASLRTPTFSPTIAPTAPPTPIPTVDGGETNGIPFPSAIDGTLAPTVGVEAPSAIRSVTPIPTQYPTASTDQQPAPLAEAPVQGDTAVPTSDDNQRVPVAMPDSTTQEPPDGLPVATEEPSDLAPVAQSETIVPSPAPTLSELTPQLPGSLEPSPELQGNNRPDVLVTARGAAGALRPAAQRIAPEQLGIEPSEEPTVETVQTGSPDSLSIGALVGIAFGSFVGVLVTIVALTALVFKFFSFSPPADANAEQV